MKFGSLGLLVASLAMTLYGCAGAARIPIVESEAAEILRMPSGELAFFGAGGDIVTFLNSGSMLNCLRFMRVPRMAQCNHRHRKFAGTESSRWCRSGEKGVLHSIHAAAIGSKKSNPLFPSPAPKVRATVSSLKK
jgi:hypothetical protein